jgi:hypothetical protein
VLTKMTSFKGKLSWAKIISLGGQKVNIAGELTFPNVCREIGWLIIMYTKMTSFREASQLGKNDITWCALVCHHTKK